MNDELGQLMKRAQDGDKAAYRELLEQLQKLALSYARAFNARVGLRSADPDGEDAVQEILLAVHDKRRTYDPTQPFLPWFYAIARYKLIDRTRARRRLWSRIFNRGAEFDFDTIGDESMRPSLAGQDLQTMIGRLPEKQQEVLALVKLQGLSIAEAANKLGLSESDVKVSVHRALKTLKREGGDDV